MVVYTENRRVTSSQHNRHDVTHVQQPQQQPLQLQPITSQLSLHRILPPIQRHDVTEFSTRAAGGISAAGTRRRKVLALGRYRELSPARKCATLPLIFLKMGLSVRFTLILQTSTAPCKRTCTCSRRRTRRHKRKCSDCVSR